MKCTFSVVRYCHDPRRGEFVNFGLLLHTPESASIITRFSAERIQRVKRLYPDVDESLIRTVKQGIESSVKPLKAQESIATYAPSLGKAMELDERRIRLLDIGYLEYLSKYHNGLIQFSAPQPVATENPKKEFERVYNLYVADPDELLSEERKELRSTIYRRLRAELKSVETRLDIDYELRRDAIHGLIKGTTVDFIGFNGQLVCGKSIDLESHGVEVASQYIAILIQVFDALRLNFGKANKRGQYYIVTKRPEDSQKKLYQLWNNLLYWSQKDYFHLTGIDGAYQIAQFVDKQNVIPFSEWLKAKKN